MTVSLYPLRFDPIFQYRLWGGRRLADWSDRALPGDGPIGEAWLLSDRDDFPSRVADGPLKGKTIAELLERSPELLMGQLSARFERFPLLLKFLDVREMLSVQVHPPDDRTDLIPKGERGKTEAWVVLESQPDARVYAGLKTGATAGALRALSKETAADYLPAFAPAPGEGIFIGAGTVHSLGGGVVVFEVQENSDVTFRLYDWDHVDPKTGRKRELTIEKAIACIDLAQGAIAPVVPVTEIARPFLRERMFDCPHFRLWRIRSTIPFTTGCAGAPQVLVCVDGAGAVEFNGSDFAMTKGAVVLIPAVVGDCTFNPGPHVTLLEIAIPDRP